jgi:hypothetical protein
MDQPILEVVYFLVERPRMLPWPAGQFYQFSAKAYTPFAIMVQAEEQAVQDDMTQRGITPSRPKSI